MTIATGFGALQKVMEEAAARGDFGPSLEYFGLSNGERIVVRFLTDDIITADFAGRVKTPAGKYQDFVIHDPNNNLVARYAQPGAWDGKLTKRTVGICVVREQRMAAQQPDTIQDPNARPRYEVVDKVSIREDGLQQRHFLLVKQSHQNFWDQLVGFFGIYNTITDRDYVIVRQGEGLKTTYRIGPLDPDPNDPLRDPKTLTEYYGYGRPFDKEAADRYMYCPQTLRQWYDYYGSEERIKHWLVPSTDNQQQAPAGHPNPAWAQQQAPQPPQPAGWGAPTPPVPPAAPPVGDPVLGGGGLGEFHPATTQNPASSPATPPPPSQVAAPDQDFASLRNRMKGYGQQQAAETPQTT